MSIYIDIYNVSGGFDYRSGMTGLYPLAVSQRTAGYKDTSGHLGHAGQGCDIVDADNAL